MQLAVKSSRRSRCKSWAINFNRGEKKTGGNPRLSRQKTPACGWSRHSGETEVGLQLVGKALAVATWPRVLCKGAEQRWPSRKRVRIPPNQIDLGVLYAYATGNRPLGLQKKKDHDNEHERDDGCSQQVLFHLPRTNPDATISIRN